MTRHKVSIYEPLSIDGYELCYPTRQEDFEAINTQVDGSPRKSTWRPMAMRIIQEDEGKHLRESDAPWLGSHALIFRRRAIEALEPLLSESGEFLPLDCGEVNISMFNPRCATDAFDEGASSVLRFSSGRIMAINRYVFRPEAVGELHAFKISSLRVSPTLLSREFVERWRSSGLKGLDFREVWSVDLS
jgi:uncharacterized protein DUF1629